MDKILCPNCPLCGEPPRFIMSLSQVFCGNDACRAITWNMTYTDVQNMESANFLNLDLPGMEQ